MSVSVIKLTFRNESNDTNNSNVVIFQKNVATDSKELTLAWKVIKDCGKDFHHPFDYPMGLSISAADSEGNYSNHIDADDGSAYAMTLDSSGHVVKGAGSAAASDEVEIKNNLVEGSISANIYRSGKLLASKPNVVPKEKALFKFKPKIFIGIVSDVVEGSVMNSAVVQQVNAELSLQNLVSADIVMRGGGSGSGSVPYTFTLENKINA